MAQFVNIFRCDLHKGPVVTSLHQVFLGDVEANRVGVRVTDNGEDVTLTGTCSGTAILCNGGTVALTGTVDGSLAYVDLPSAVYTVEGPVEIYVTLTQGDQTTTLLTAHGNAVRTDSGVVIDPGTIIPSVAALISDIEDAVASIPEDYSELSADVVQLKSDMADVKPEVETLGEDVSDLKSASVEYHSMNLFDKSAAQDGYQINGVVGDTEVLYANSSRVVSDLILCKNGDSFYITRIDSSNAFGNISNSNFVCAVALDSAGKILKRSEWVNPFTVDVNAVNVRFCITSSVFTNNKIVNITKNYYPTTKKPVDDYAEYMVARNQVNTHVIDLWGDSRIENGATENTDIGYYLQGLTNTGIEQTPTYGILYNAPGYTVCNNGIGAQASGMVAARLGSNDVYVTLYENQIRATGESLVTGLRCSTGQEANFNSWSVQAEKGVPCILCGVHGWLVRSQNTIKFIRNTDGNAVTVRPRTKIDVLDKHSGNHICVLWAGKNDMTLADGFQVNGVIGNMAGMVQYLHHDKFIVLGETYDNDTSTYGTGKAYRGYVDEINNWYKAHYPNNFIDIQTELVTNGLTIAGITPTEQDETDISNGFIPSSLMQDDTHPNAAGREVIAKILSAWMKAKSWIE